MKSILLSLALALCAVHTQAQDLALNEKVITTTTSIAHENTSGKTPSFTFQNYGVDLSHADLKEYPEHAWGDSIARKKCAFLSVYLQRHTATLGFSDNKIDIYKPAIYNAVSKLESYLKKAVRKHEIELSKASNYLSKCLDVAYLAYYEEKTGVFEKTLKKAKTPQELLNIFQTIQIEG